jgi:hypothetical protein
MTQNLTDTDKLSLSDWLTKWLPFTLPHIPLVQTANNLDKAAASIVAAAGNNIVARVRASTTRVDAKSDAEKALIEFGKDQLSHAPQDIADRAMQYALGDAISKQLNRENIFRLAGEKIAADPPETDASSQIDDDWLSFFRQCAETKSDADVQKIWARILSSEISQPGTVSLRTLAFLSTASSKDAALAVKAFSFVVQDDALPEFSNDKGYLSVPEILELQAMGLIAGGIGLGAMQMQLTGRKLSTGEARIEIVYFDKAALLYSDNTNFQIEYPAVKLTEIGSSLFFLADTKLPNPDYFESFALSLKKPPVKKITIADIGNDKKLVEKSERIIFAE